MAGSTLSFLLENSFERDDREPMWFLEAFGRTLGVTSVDLRFWMITFGCLLLQTFVNVMVAFIVYKGILKHRGTSFSFLLGYGFVIPTLLYLPGGILPMLKFRNLTFLGAVSMGSPCLLTYRCLEAMHGTLPRFAYDTSKAHKKNSLRQFVTYYASSIQFNLTDKGDAVPVKWVELQQRMVHFLRMFLETTILSSLMLHYQYQLFDVATWTGRIANNFAMAYLTGAGTESGIIGLGIMTSLLTGISTSHFHDHPFLHSRSPSDFWGRRWNKIVGEGLRRGIYMPLRKANVVASAATMATFVVSGLMHEYVLVTMTLREGIPNNTTGNTFQPNFGNHLIFFVWNGVILLLEFALRGSRFIKFLSSTLPRPIRTALVLLTVLPVAHLFTDEYVNSCFYNDLAIGFPRIDLID